MSIIRERSRNNPEFQSLAADNNKNHELASTSVVSRC